MASVEELIVKNQFAKHPYMYKDQILIVQQKLNIAGLAHNAVSNHQFIEKSELVRRCYKLFYKTTKSNEYYYRVGFKYSGIWMPHCVKNELTDLDGYIFFQEDDEGIFRMSVELDGEIPFPKKLFKIQKMIAKDFLIKSKYIIDTHNGCNSEIINSPHGIYLTRQLNGFELGSKSHKILRLLRRLGGISEHMFCLLQEHSVGGRLEENYLKERLQLLESYKLDFDKDISV